MLEIYFQSRRSRSGLSLEIVRSRTQGFNLALVWERVFEDGLSKSIFGCRRIDIGLDGDEFMSSDISGKDGVLCEGLLLFGGTKVVFGEKLLEV